MSFLVYSVDFRHSNGNMHVGVSGEFNQNTADAVLEILQRAYTGSGRIFIDTAKINSIVDSGAEYFKAAFAGINVPTACLFFKGEKGRNIGPNGSKLLLVKEREKKPHSGCCGKCKNSDTKSGFNKGIPDPPSCIRRLTSRRGTPDARGWVSSL